MRALVFWEQISEESVASFVEQASTPQYRRQALINSTGGDPAAIVEMASAVQACAITTIADHVYSAAIYLYALGRRRVAHADTIFGFHQMTMFGGDNDEWLTIGGLRLRTWQAAQLGSPKYQRYQQDVDLMYGLRVATLDLLVETTGTDRGTFINLMEQEVALTAGEALRLNLVQRIVPQAQIIDLLEAA